jgi:hypothetical protein
MKKALVAFLLLTTVQALAQTHGWQKASIVTAGEADDHNPQIDHAGLADWGFFGASEWIVFERQSNGTATIAGVRYLNYRSVWDTVATVISPGYPGVDQRLPDICSLHRWMDHGSTIEGKDWVLAAWQRRENDIWNVYYSVFAGDSGSWSSIRSLTSDNVNNTDVKIRPFADTSLILVWRRLNVIMYSLFNGVGMSSPETVYVAGSDSVEYDLSQRGGAGGLVWTTFDRKEGRMNLATAQIESLSPVSLIFTDTIVCPGNIRSPNAMFHWYSPCLSFEVEENGHLQAWTAHYLYFMTRPWVAAILAGDGDPNYYHPSICYIPFSSMGFGTLERRSSQDTAVIFFDTEGPRQADTVVGGRKPVTGSVITYTLGGKAEVLAVWEMNSMGYSHIYESGFLFDFGDRVDDPSLVPSAVTLQQNYPNPFNPKTAIEYSVASTQYVSLKIYDVLGREVASLVDETRQPGVHSVSWDARGFSSGVYFYRLQSGGFTETKRMILLR